MAKFFKNYNIINLKIFNEVESQVDKKSLNDFNIQPKYLAMLYLKHCDFCCNNDNEDTFINNLNFFYGYQICSKCDNKKIGETYIKNWYVKNKCLPIEYINIFDVKQSYRIQRSSGIFEDEWNIDSQYHIQYTIKSDGSEDLLIPMYKAVYSPRDRSANKKIYLSELCRFNNLNESSVIKIFKDKFEEFQNN